MTTETGRTFGLVSLAAGLVAVAIGVTACDPGAGITWVNETDETVYIYLGDDLDDFDGTIPPHASLEAATIKAVWEDVVVVRDADQNVILRKEITWDELKKNGFRFVIPETAR